MTQNAATITVTHGQSERTFSAPTNILDLTPSILEEQGADRALSVALVRKGLRLYAHGDADLGYGIKATITGQL